MNGRPSALLPIEGYGTPHGNFNTAQCNEPALHSANDASMRNMWKSVLSYPLGPRDEIQVIGLSVRHLTPWCFLQALQELWNKNKNYELRNMKTITGDLSKIVCNKYPLNSLWYMLWPTYLKVPMEWWQSLATLLNINNS